VSGEIAVRAYRTEARADKRVLHRRRLPGAVLEQQPPAPGEVLRRALHDDAQTPERILSGAESKARLVRQSGPGKDRIPGSHIGWIAEEEIETLAGERLEPAALAEVDA